MDHGKLAEEGTHEQLLEMGGTYSRLWEQQGGFTVGDGAQYVGVEATRLQAVPLFKDLDGELVAALASRPVMEKHPENEVIFDEGDPGDRLYVIERNGVEVVTTGPSGEERRLARLRDGDYFEEMALLEDVARTATIRATTATVLFALEREHLFDVMRLVPELRDAPEQVAESRKQATLEALREAAG